MTDNLFGKTLAQDLFDPIAQARAAGAMAIESPICNGPYEEPQRYWQVVDLATGLRTEPQLLEGRREAGYFYSPKGARYESSALEEEFVRLDCVNEIRRRVRQWREDGYRGATPVTRRLLEHWGKGKPERELPLFFCQREAVETIIWLHEAHAADRQGLMVETVDGDRVALDDAHEVFRRYCLKMATGTGKTIVMAMLIAWSVINKASYPQDTRFSDAVLIVAPGLTVKERLAVLLPKTETNYYRKFHLVPSGLFPYLDAAKIHILHRQEMAHKDDTGKRGVTKLGPESDAAFAGRLLKKQLGSKKRLLVLNDEGHHCYRPRFKEEKDATKDEKEENARAAQWISGLERIHEARGILSCVDLSATPFYIHGSGYPVGRPFPWIVSDFGLVDAIESGLVKIPRIPVDDDLVGSPPAYFHLWRWINERLPAGQRETGRRKAKPDAVVHSAEPALLTMIGNWKGAFVEWASKGEKVPPVMIVITQDTELSQLLFERLTAEHFEFNEFVNTPGKQVTYLFDSKELKNSEEGEKVKDAELRKRAVMNSVGQEGRPGASVRCIVSVSMLTEGWDANNVTQIVGLRAFTSQLLCEQVVGRALRRRTYEVGQDGLLEAEYADVYGVPFQVIPVKATGKHASAPPPPTTLVRALPEREALELTFPIVDGYVTEWRERVVCDWEAVPRLRIGHDEPTQVAVKDVAGYRIGNPDIGGPGSVSIHDRVPYYLLARVSSACFRIASRIVAYQIPGDAEKDAYRRSRLFPQVLGIVKRYVGEYLVYDSVPTEEVTLEREQEKVVNVLSEYIVSDAGGEAVHLPKIDRKRPFGSTRDVQFRTGREVVETVKSHISHVVLDAPSWEGSVAHRLERMDCVSSYARNDHLDFVVPYVDLDGTPRGHQPDFIVRLNTGLHVALEVKGFERESDRVKESAGKKWASAVNRYFGEVRWRYIVCKNPENLEASIAKETSLSPGPSPSEVRGESEPG